MTLLLCALDSGLTLELASQCDDEMAALFIGPAMSRPLLSTAALPPLSQNYFIFVPNSSQQQQAVYVTHGHTSLCSERSSAATTGESKAKQKRERETERQNRKKEREDHVPVAREGGDGAGPRWPAHDLVVHRRRRRHGGLLVVHPHHNLRVPTVPSADERPRPRPPWRARLRLLPSPGPPSNHHHLLGLFLARGFVHHPPPPPPWPCSSSSAARFPFPSHREGVASSSSSPMVSSARSLIRSLQFSPSDPRVRDLPCQFD